MALLYPFSSFKWGRKFYNWIKYDGPLRTVYLVFFFDMFIDLFIGGLINLENGFLLDAPGNWGPNGNLTFSD